MGEYIEREAVYSLAKKICDAIYSKEFQRLNFGRRILDLIDDLPAADVKPMVHGKWKERRFSENVYGVECSVCHTTWDTVTDYCPFCGAEMR